jgi:hypothetical protein
LCCGRHTATHEYGEQQNKPSLTWLRRANPFSVLSNLVQTGIPSLVHWFS